MIKSETILSSLPDYCLYLTNDRGGVCLWPAKPQWSESDRLFVEPDGDNLETLSLDPKQAAALLGCHEPEMNSCTKIQRVVT